MSEAGAGRVQMLTLQGAPLQVLRLPTPTRTPAPNPNPALTPTPTLHQVLRLPTAGKLYGMCVSGSRVFVADYERHQVHVLQLGSGTPSSPPPQPW